MKKERRKEGKKGRREEGEKERSGEGKKGRSRAIEKTVKVQLSHIIFHPGQRREEI